MRLEEPDKSQLNLLIPKATHELIQQRLEPWLRGDDLGLVEADPDGGGAFRAEAEGQFGFCATN